MRRKGPFYHLYKLLDKLLVPKYAIHMKSYEQDYEETMEAMQAALRKRDQIDTQIQTLQKRIEALEVLIREDYPHKRKLVLDQNTTPMQAVVNVLQPQITEMVRNLFKLTGAPLTSGEIYDKLQQFGAGLGSRSNPWALIHGICRRLVDQGFAKEVDKNGKKAWVIVKS
jgi:hypothetical protein